MLKVISKFILLALLVFLVSNFLGNFVSEKRRGHQVWEDFYEIPKNSLDMIFMGSSLSYSSFNPLVFNGYMDVNSYNTGTAVQNIKQSYYNLKEIIAYQSPRLIVLEAYSLDIPDKSEENRLGFKFENIDPQKFSMRKLVSVNNQFSTFKNKINALSPLVRNHNEWDDLNLLQTNLEHTRQENKFLGYKPVHTDLNKKELKKTIKELPSRHFFSEDNLNYFEKFVELCEKNDIKLMVVRAPVLLYKYNTEYYNQVYENTRTLCDSKKIEYIDYNQKFNELGFNESHFGDAKHLNYKGATKISELLASTLNKVEIKKSTESREASAPEDYIYSNKNNEIGQTIFKGAHFVDDITIINEVKLMKFDDDEYSIIVKMEDGLNAVNISNYKFGYYFYPVESQVPLLKTEKDLKRKYTSKGGTGVPMYFKGNYYVTLRSYKTNITDYKRVKIQLYNKQGVYGKSLIIKNVLFQ